MLSSSNLISRMTQELMQNAFVLPWDVVRQTSRAALKLLPRDKQFPELIRGACMCLPTLFLYFYFLTSNLAKLESCLLTEVSGGMICQPCKLLLNKLNLLSF